MNSMGTRQTVLSSIEIEGLLIALEALGVAWWIKDDSGSYLNVGAATAALLAVEPSRLIGHRDTQILSTASAEGLALIEQQAIRRGAVQQGEQVIEVDGVRIDLACAVLPLRSQAGSPAAVLGVWLDRSALRGREAELRAVLAQLEAQQQAQRELRAEADSAAARGAARVVGREVFDEHLAREIDLSVREHREFAVVLIGIDPDVPARDDDARGRIVEVFDGMLRSNTRAMDVPSRQSGERFALLLSGVGLATAHARMEGLRRQCATQVVARRGEALHFTVSMGVASYPHTAPTRIGLIGAAQAALDQARERGGNQVALASIAFVAGESPGLSP
jgi:diguanylate cyclase (GGDEF)-like protein